jgi:CMP-N,N'-diacetyllegionaminic acid synthase
MECMVNIKILIPARGGSKRIPRKNLVDLNGKPLLYYSIRQALNITNDVYVSTEDTEIQEFVESMGANVIERPERLAQDNSKSEDVVEHFLEEIDTDLFCLIQPTVPLLSSQYILEGMELIEDYDSVISVCEDVNYYWNVYGEPINFELGNRKRTQEHQTWYKENGAFYITRKYNFLKSNILQNGNVGFVVMKESESIDIDTHEDLKLVKKIMRGNK